MITHIIEMRLSTLERAEAIAEQYALQGYLALIEVLDRNIPYALTCVKRAPE